MFAKAVTMKKNRKNESFSSNQQPKIENDNNNKNDVNKRNFSTYENHRHVTFGPSNVKKLITC